MEESKKQVNYTDEPMEMGKRVEDFLPPPKELIYRPKSNNSRD